MTFGYTAIYWGAFDPLTSAHQAIIHAALELSLIRNLIIVINNHDYKKYTTSLETRKASIQFFVSSITTPKTIQILSQDNQNPLNHQTLKQMTSHPLCAVAGYDAYHRWMTLSSTEDRAQYGAIAVIPRREQIPTLFDPHAFVLHIDPIYKNVASSHGSLQKRNLN